MSELNKRISIFGVGPKIFISLCPFLIVFGYIEFIFHPAFIFPLNYYWMVVIGSILLAFGIFMFVYSERVMSSAYNSSSLATSKIYAHIRHSMYAFWDYGILPGIFCFLNSWIFLLNLIAYYLIFKIFIKEEEKYLLKEFGKGYEHYRKNVNAIFPKLSKYKPKE